MGFPLDLSIRYMRSKKRATISIGTGFAIVGVALGVMALATVLSVTGGFRAQFREKVLGVNAHVLVLKYINNFREYPRIMRKIERTPGVIGIAPFAITATMITHESHTATGVLLKGVDPVRVGSVLDLPRHVVKGSLGGLRASGAVSDGADRASKGVQAAAPADTPGDVADESDASPPSDAGAADDDLGALPADAPRGNVVPDGGYESELPDEDELPVELDSDPCRDASTVKTLPGLVIGVTLARNLQVDLGDCVQVTSPMNGFVNFTKGARPAVAKRFRIVAVFDAGFDQYDSKFVYADLLEAQAFYGKDNVTGIEMKVADIEKAREVADRIEVTLHDDIYHTLDWEQLNHGLFTALKIQQILMSLVLALIIIVAAFTVIATLIMVVLDKKKEIAVLKAMGAADGALLRTFLYQGTIIGIVGTTIGLALGLLVCKWLLVYGVALDPKVYFISRLPVQVRLLDFALVGVFGVLVCVVATLWPALYAARLRPAEAFREQD
jgi:lipoprotein-releasing system permease protein